MNCARLCAVAVTCCAISIADAQEPPDPPREFRAAWIATVANIDWPSAPGLSVQTQQAELTRLLDRAAKLNLNAIIFQVRPAADAIYQSPLEPWSPYLTGKMGAPPQPLYDPLEFAVTTAHERGLELHVWFNPYRALHKSFEGDVSADHISNTHPDYVREYDGYLWLDPGHPLAMRHSLDVITDVVRRYDIDGVHLDDYFYPYPTRDALGNEVPFPDDTTWHSAQVDIPRDDWRRDNVNRLIEGMYREVKAAKPWVKVGISPFGIWRPGHPEGIKGFDAYAKLYADARKWLQEGWLDYITPQLYWPIDSEGQSYPKLLNWWHDQNVMHRHLWPGNFASRVGMQGKRAWPVEELLQQVAVTRDQAGASGNVHFSMKALMPSYGPLGEQLGTGPYAQPALVPASPWLDNSIPGKARVVTKLNDQGITLHLASKTQPWLWVVQSHRDGLWQMQVVPGAEASITLEPANEVAVSMLSRTGVQGPAVVVSTSE